MAPVQVPTVDFALRMAARSTNATYASLNAMVLTIATEIQPPTDTKVVKEAKLAKGTKVAKVKAIKAEKAKEANRGKCIEKQVAATINLLRRL